MSTFVNDVQFSKTLPSKRLTEDGIVTSVNDVQLSKALV